MRRWWRRDERGDQRLEIEVETVDSGGNPAVPVREIACNRSNELRIRDAKLGLEIEEIFLTFFFNLQFFFSIIEE